MPVKLNEPRLLWVNLLFELPIISTLAELKIVAVETPAVKTWNDIRIVARNVSASALIFPSVINVDEPIEAVKMIICGALVNN